MGRGNVTARNLREKKVGHHLNQRILRFLHNSNKSFYLELRKIVRERNTKYLSKLQKTLCKLKIRTDSICFKRPFSLLILKLSVSQFIFSNFISLSYIDTEVRLMNNCVYRVQMFHEELHVPSNLMESVGAVSKYYRKMG